MKRRDFLVTAAAAGAALVSSAPGLSAAEPAGRDLLELRVYHFASPAKLDAFEGFCSKAVVPAMKRAGVSPVGVFKLSKADNPDLKLEADPLDLYVLRPFATPEALVLVPRALAADATFQRDGAPFLAAPKSDPAFARYESSLLLAFTGMPHVTVPVKGPSRLFQLRIYESHSEERARKKIEMFNEGGEIAIFQRCGMTPVFFGQALIGARLPNLHYMLGFEDKESMDRGWAAFRADPGWTKLKDDPAYKDTVSNITNLVLRPSAASEI
jgi:hypothetical protein